MQRTHGYNSIDTAKLCFQENLNQFIDSKTDPDKHNLNKGLYKMAETIESMQNDIEQLKAIIVTLTQELQRRK